MYYWRPTLSDNGATHPDIRFAILAPKYLFVLQILSENSKKLSNVCTIRFIELSTFISPYREKGRSNLIFMWN